MSRSGAEGTMTFMGGGSRTFFRPAILALSLGVVVTARAAEFYVSPSGSASQDGTRERPWDLATALGQPPAVTGGDTIWLRGGTYVGRFESVLAGTQDAPIVVRQVAGERARIDGGPGPIEATLTIGGQYAWYWGFEVFSSGGRRTSSEDGSAPTDLNRGSCIGGAQDGPHPGIRLINLILHDGTDAIGFFEAEEDAEIHGNLIYNNGWDGATDRGHGNGMYIQNRDGKKRITDNIVFGQYEQGLQIYGSDAAYLDNIEVIGNSIYENGAPSAHGRARNLLFGGGRIAHDGRIESNVTYHADSAEDSVTTGVSIGYVAGISRFTVQGNWFTAGSGIFSCDFSGAIDQLTMTGNDFVRGVDGIDLGAYPDNVYYGDVRPTGLNVFVRKNAYEPGRANITVLNWDRLPFVDVDLRGVLSLGTPFEIRNAQAFFSPAVVAGVWDGGAIRLPLSGLTAASPIGAARAAVPTGPEFNVFILLPYRLPCAFDDGARLAGAQSRCTATGATGGTVVTHRRAH